MTTGKPAALTGERMTEIRERSGLTVRAVARYHHRAESTFRQFEAGERAIPATIADWFLSLEAWLEQNPPVEKVR